MAAPWDGRLATFLGYGDVADRPATPNTAPGILCIWYDTVSSTFAFYESVAAAWTDFPTPLTTEQTQDIVAAMFVAGVNMTVTYNDGAGTITLDGKSDEQIEDLMSTFLTAGANIQIDYDDAGNVLEISVTGITVIDELANLTDVDLTGLADGDTLIWDAGTSKFIPGTPSGGGGSGYPTTPPTLRGGDVATANASSVVMTIPGSAVAGDLAFAWVASGYGSNPLSGWTWLDRKETGNWSSGLAYKVLDSTDITAGTITWTFGGSFQCTGALWVYDASTVAGVYWYEVFIATASYLVDGSTNIWGTPWVPVGSHIVYGGSTRANDTMASDGTSIDATANGNGSTCIWTKSRDSASGTYKFKIDESGMGSTYSLLRCVVMGSA